jgi:hypothetical protein
MRRLRDLLPFLPCLLGLSLAVWRFRLRDPLGGLVFGELGMLLMTAIAARMPARGAASSPAGEAGPPRAE